MLPTKFTRFRAPHRGFNWSRWGLVGVLLVAGTFGLAHGFGQVFSASLNNVSVTTTNSRPSFRGALDAGNIAGDTTVTIDTSGSYPSNSTNQFIQGDAIKIGVDPVFNPYQVDNTVSASVFTITSGLLAGDEVTGADVMAAQTASLNVRLTTLTAVNNGKLRLLIPEVGGATSHDGIPDGGGFDYGSSAPTVTCPNNLTGYTFAVGVPSADAVVLNGQRYHSYVCSYTGAGAAGTAFDGGVHGMMTISTVINPAPLTGHTSGTADAYAVIVQQLDSTSALVDTTAVKVGFIESVKVLAHVTPQLSFGVSGVDANTSACGTNTSVTTTASTVPFGSLDAGTFKTAAQTLTVSTNAAGGYVVTAAENDQLGKNGDPCVGEPTTAGNSNCIQDTRGDNGNASDMVSDEWTSTAQPGFGYSLDDHAGLVNEAFSYNESGRTFSARQFPDLENSGVAQTIFTNSSPANNDNLYACYKIMPDITTSAGDYQNFLTYTATATF